MPVTPAVADRIRQANVDVHRREAPMYDALHSEIFGTDQQRRVRRELDLIGKHIAAEGAPRALDVGCGTGNLTLQLVGRGFFVKAVDLSPDMIEVLRSKLTPEQAARTEVVVSDAEAALATGEEKWDLISFSAVLHHLPDYRTVLAQALRRLKPGGLLYVCHEPLLRNSSRAGGWDRFVENVCRRVDGALVRARVVAVYGLHSLRARRLVERLDYTWSDYHVAAGIDMLALISALEAEGGRAILQETYPSYYSSLLAAAAVRLSDPKPDHFRFIVQAP